jgi:hypothetical protein
MYTSGNLPATLIIIDIRNEIRLRMTRRPASPAASPRILRSRIGFSAVPVRRVSLYGYGFFYGPGTYQIRRVEASPNRYAGANIRG